MADVIIDPLGGSIAAEIEFEGVFNAGWVLNLYPPLDPIPKSNDPIITKSGKRTNPEPYKYDLPDLANSNIGCVINITVSYNNKDIINGDIKGSIKLIIKQDGNNIEGDSKNLTEINATSKTIYLSAKLIKENK